MGKETGKAKESCVGRNALNDLRNGQPLNYDVFYILIWVDLLERFPARVDPCIRQPSVSQIAANIGKPYRRRGALQLYALYNFETLMID